MLEYRYMKSISQQVISASLSAASLWEDGDTQAKFLYENITEKNHRHEDFFSVFNMRVTLDIYASFGAVTVVILILSHG